MKKCKDCGKAMAESDLNTKCQTCRDLLRASKNSKIEIWPTNASDAECPNGPKDENQEKTMCQKSKDEPWPNGPSDEKRWPKNPKIEMPTESDPIKFYIGDSMELIKGLPNECLDAVITDPPYNISNETKISPWKKKAGKSTTRGAGRTISLDFGAWDHGTFNPADFIELITPKLKPNGVFIMFYDKRFISHIADILESHGYKIRHIAGWNKTNPTPQARRVKWCNALELFIIATRNHGEGHHYNYKAGQMGDCITTSTAMGRERREHPTQKPEKLIEPIIKWWTFQGDLIIDPFAGTGTTGAVAKYLHRRCLLIEQDPRWDPEIKRRLNKVMVNKIKSVEKPTLAEFIGGK